MLQAYAGLVSSARGSRPSQHALLRYTEAARDAPALRLALRHTRQLRPQDVPGQVAVMLVSVAGSYEYLPVQTLGCLLELYVEN